MKTNIGVHQFVAKLFDKSLDIANLGVREPKVRSESNWLQPKLHFIIAARDMNMRRLVILATVKVKTIRANSQDSRHGSSCGMNMMCQPMGEIRSFGELGVASRKVGTLPCA
jgi:hypothetical protein